MTSNQHQHQQQQQSEAAAKKSKRTSFHRTKSGKVFDPYDPFFAEDGPHVGSSTLVSSPNTIEPTDAAFRKPPPMPSVHTDGRGEVHNLLIGSYHTRSSGGGSGGGSSGNSGGGSGSGSNKAGGSSRSGESSDEGKTTPSDPTTSSSTSTTEHPATIPTRRINLSHTKKGVMRHGDFHPNTQCSFLFSGSVEVWTANAQGSTVKTIYGPKSYIEIPPYVPHVYNCLQDTVMAEWWESTGSGAPAHFKHWFYAPYRRIVDVSFVRTTAGEKGRLHVFREVGRETGDTASSRELLEMLRPPGETNWLAWLGAGTVVGCLGFVLGVSVGRGKGA